MNHTLTLTLSPSGSTQTRILCIIEVESGDQTYSTTQYLDRDTAFLRAQEHVNNHLQRLIQTLQLQIKQGRNSQHG